MKKTSKLVAILVALMLVLGLAGAAMAAYATDAQGTKFFNSFNRLSALGVFTGDPDGKVRPADPITRAEFAAVAVRSLGLDQAAQFAKGTTAFVDVSANHWASGYINVATSQGIIKGDPPAADGAVRFRPDDNVSYAEAVTMLIRAVGHEPFVVGAWPTGHITKAVELGITKGTTFSANQPATRGDVALMTDKATVEVNIVKATGYNSKGEPTYEIQVGQTLANTKLQVTEWEATVTDVPVTNANLNGKVTVSAVPAGSGIPTTVKVADASNAALNGLLGKKVKAGAKEIETGEGKEWQVIYLNSLTASDKVVSGTINKAVTAGTDTKVEVKVGSEVKTYDFTGGVTTIAGSYNHATAGDVAGNMAKSRNITLILDDGGKARYAIVTNYAVDLVKEVEIKDVDGAKDNKLILEGATYTGDAGVSKNVVISRNGETAALGDLKQNDVVRLVVSGGQVRAIVATTNSVTGTLSKAIQDGTTLKATVGGTEYSVDNNNPFRQAAGSSSWTAGLAKANLDPELGNGVEILLTDAGKIAAVRFSPSTTDVKGIVSAVKSKLLISGSSAVNSYTFETVLADGSKKIVDSADYSSTSKFDFSATLQAAPYNLAAGGAASTATAVQTALKGLVVNLKLNSDGLAKTVDLVNTRTSGRTIAASGVSTSANTVTFNAVAGEPASVNYSGSTVVLDYTGDTPVVGSMDSLKDGQVVDVFYKAGVAAINDAKYVVINTSAAQTGVFLKAYTESDATNTYNYVEVLTKNGVQKVWVGKNTAPNTTFEGAAYTKGSIVDSMTLTRGQAAIAAFVAADFRVDPANTNSLVVDVNADNKTITLDADGDGVLSAGDTVLAVTSSTLIVQYTDDDKADSLNPVLSSLSYIKKGSYVHVNTNGAGTKTDVIVIRQR